MTVHARPADAPLPAEVWRQPGMVEAVAARDIATVYRLLQRYRIPQRRIAALTGQSQSEISEIIAGRRVQSVDLLTRICDGLGIARCQMGLGCDPNATPTESTGQGGCPWRVASPGEANLMLTPEELEVVRRILRTGLHHGDGAGLAGGVVTPLRWTGETARLLRMAYRHSIRRFAGRLGVSERMVSKWEAGGEQLTPRPDSQSLLDTMLARAPEDVRLRFEAANGKVRAEPQADAVPDPVG
jgi:transcriptional regulator with XRE-family HTH domain